MAVAKEAVRKRLPRRGKCRSLPLRVGSSSVASWVRMCIEGKACLKQYGGHEPLEGGQPIPC